MSKRSVKDVLVGMKGTKVTFAKYRGVNILPLVKWIGKICKYVDVYLDEELNDKVAAKRIGVPHGTIVGWRNRLGFKPVRTHRSGKQMRKITEEAKRLRAEGFSFAKIGKKLGLPGQWIYQILKKGKR